MSTLSIKTRAALKRERVLAKLHVWVHTRKTLVQELLHICPYSSQVTGHCVLSLMYFLALNELFISSSFECIL